MSTNRNLATLNEARDLFNAGDIESYIQTLYAPDVAAHFLPPGLPPGHDGLRLFYGAFVAAFPDIQLYFDEIVSEGDKVAIRYHVAGTHQGEFNGIPATGRSVSFTGTTIFRFVDGQAVERWSESDMLGLMQQLGVIPEPA